MLREDTGPALSYKPVFVVDRVNEPERGQERRGAREEKGDGGREREETDSQDLDEAWEKRGLVEEQQKCLRTFLCDYTALDKSRHSCRFFFHPLRLVLRLRVSHFNG